MYIRGVLEPLRNNAACRGVKNVFSEVFPQNVSYIFKHHHQFSDGRRSLFNKEGVSPLFGFVFIGLSVLESEAGI